MADETTRTVGAAELADFGNYLSELRGADLTFELPDASRRMIPSPLDAVLAAFRAFYAGNAPAFKVRITFDEGRPGMMSKTIEFTRAS